jgi:diguanylate cyclase (GGDEF)-like protein/PAS domain S-box-containing protein
MGAGLHAAVLLRNEAWCTSAPRRDAALTAVRDEERCRLALLGADDGVWDWNLLGTFYVCPRWKAQLGLQDDERPACAADWLDRVHPADRTSLRQALSDHLAGRTDRLRHEHRLRHADGTWRWMLCRGRAIRGVDGVATRIAGTMVDISDQAAAHARLCHAAFHDSLTGLANRSLLLALLTRAIETHQPGRRYAVLFVDVNGFKQVNDTHGHVMGDALLVAIARRLESSLRAFDTACRYGGDEFAVLLSAIDAPAQAVEIAARLQAMLGAPYTMAGRELPVTASIGGVVAGDGAKPPEALIAAADAAMYRAKAAGGTRPVIDGVAAAERGSSSRARTCATSAAY